MAILVNGGFYLVVELHREGSAPAGLFFSIKQSFSAVLLKVVEICNIWQNKMFQTDKLF